jgi:hypothetical protein
MNNSRCFVLAEEWTAEAIEAAKEGLGDDPGATRIPRSCAAEVVTKMGGTPQEAAMAAGFGGGIGLSGNACGALGAAMWFKGLQWVRTHPGKTPNTYSNTGDKRTLKVFTEATEGEFTCSKICGRNFESVDDHTEYLDSGGCGELIETLASS